MPTILKVQFNPKSSLQDHHYKDMPHNLHDRRQSHETTTTCCDCAESLLPGGVPYLKFDALPIQLDGPNLEVNPARRPNQPLCINITPCVSHNNHQNALW